METVIKGIMDDFKKDFIFLEKNDNKLFEHLISYITISKYSPNSFSDNEDIESVNIDEKGQFGLDSMAIVINGNLIKSKDDLEMYNGKNDDLDVKIIFIQSKLTEKIDLGDFLKTTTAVRNFLKKDHHMLENNSNIKNILEIYETLFSNYEYTKRFTPNSPECFIYFVTLSKEISNSSLNEMKARQKEDISVICSDIKNFYVDILGKQYVIDAYKEVTNNISTEIYFKNSLQLDEIPNVKEARIGYLSGEEFLKIIQDTSGYLRKRIFYENVRDYQGSDNFVNKEIRETIENNETRDYFILMNNGLTIITKGFQSLGGNKFALRDFQIVNGCQTTNEIFNTKNISKNLLIPVKIIHTDNMDVIAKIVKANNRQSPISDEAFITLTIFHKELQDYIKYKSKEMPLKVFYARRMGETDKDIKDKYQVITLHGLIRAFTSVYLQKTNETYNNNPALILKRNKDKFFKETHPSDIYYIAVYLIANFIKFIQNNPSYSEYYDKKNYIAMITRCLLTETVDIPSFESKQMKNEITKILKVIKEDKLDDYYKKAINIILQVNEKYSNNNPSSSKKQISSYNNRTKAYNDDILKKIKEIFKK